MGGLPPYPRKVSASMFLLAHDAERLRPDRLLWRPVDLYREIGHAVGKGRFLVAGRPTGRLSLCSSYD